MNIIIRTDSSVNIGTGHVMRCLTLADELKKNEANVEFICRELEGNIIDIIEGKGFVVNKLPKPEHGEDKLTGYAKWLEVKWEIDAEETKKILKSKSNIDLLIIDHYAIDRKWESRLRSYTKRIMVIDDLANREHDTDILLDQNYVENMETRYDRLVPPICKKLLGPQYVLLRPEFYQARANLRERDGTVRRILIFFGGSDPTNETAKAIRAVAKLNCTDLEVDVVVGASNPHKEEIKKLCFNYSYNYLHQVNNMAELMAKADLAIGAGGATTWERCFLGLPSICIIIADNQEEIIKALDHKEAIINMGRKEQSDSNKLYNALQELINDKEKLIRMSFNSFDIMRGNSPNLINKIINTQKDKQL